MLTLLFFLIKAQDLTDLRVSDLISIVPQLLSDTNKIPGLPTVGTPLTTPIMDTGNTQPQPNASPSYVLATQISLSHPTLEVPPSTPTSAHVGIPIALLPAETQQELSSLYPTASADSPLSTVSNLYEPLPQGTSLGSSPISTELYTFPSHKNSSTSDPLPQFYGPFTIIFLISSSI